MQLLTNIHFPGCKWRANMPCMTNALANLMKRIAYQLAVSIAGKRRPQTYWVKHPPDFLRRDVGLSEAEQPRPWQDYL